MTPYPYASVTSRIKDEDVTADFHGREFADADFTLLVYTYALVS